ncbi:Protein HIRA [Orchesella cincta]|uniref:Protein HIRA n=1 Tax=Orchesella cincta TaxID=48709 RepID=A0A1D2MHT2_ORCCI|nr:Protein HIRA [Orchesella cincta]
MRLLKPSWLHHDGNPIFSIDIHPDDTRVVTGGQGNDSVGRVVIWNMQPILSKEEDATVPKLLCQLDHHNACVNCVRWSNSGKSLCSGGDDRVIIVWKLVSRFSGNVSTTAQNSAFGKTNLEQWKPSCMLRSHTGDILDLAWSPGDRYLASASVDNTVIVWDAQKFPQIVTTLKEHNSLVKGVTWDPVGKYLASQSDDKTLKIWRVSDWELEHSVQDPFVECGGTTHVLRLDWSPDGSYLVSAHAMNGGGPTAHILQRTEWKTNKDFVGHRKAVVCVKFNNNILQSDNSRMQHCCVALGSRDRSVSIWSTALKRPLVVIKDLFTNSVMDLSWSSCGTVMMACSWDGSVAVAQFSWKEIGKPLSPEEKANFYHKQYGKSAVSENCDIIQNLEVFLAKSKVVPSSGAVENSRITPEGVVEVIPQPERVVKGPIDKQIETRTADGRRRITPKFLLPPTDGEQAVTTKSTFFNALQQSLTVPPFRTSEFKIPSWIVENHRRSQVEETY